MNLALLCVLALQQVAAFIPPKSSAHAQYPFTADGTSSKSELELFRRLMDPDSPLAEALGLLGFSFNKDSKKVDAKLDQIVAAKYQPTAVDNVSEEEIRALFYLWNDALATGDSRLVAARYAKDAVLLPTVSDTPRTNYDSIKDYFDTFLLRKPRGVVLESFVKIGKGWAKDSGIYEFTMGDNGQKVRARYSYMYVKENGVWKILHHHSSVMPESIVVGQKITEDQVRGLFHLWNDALATEDSTLVAKRYAKKAVLLPTVSDIPRTNFSAIKDYFDTFLTFKPQGKIIESNVDIGTNWASDAGIYEFTMGKDGSKVKGRYSFIYVFEDGEWKISHHHSSFMPEGIPKVQPITDMEVRALFSKWNAALATGDSSKVAACYSKKAVLLPTISDKPRIDPASIQDYFDTFLKRKPQGVIKSGDIVVGANWAQDAGIYVFTMGDDGSKVEARYSFVYVFEDGEWKISHHHSSVMPEQLLSKAARKDAAPVEEDIVALHEVKALFNLWNEALATGDSRLVAARYAKDAVLLPTVSDTPRTSYESIKDYFDTFLLRKPRGVIKESFIKIGRGWAKDSGIYEFTMGDNGQKVKARYSFMYTKENGQWKILHHHSSVMPESIAVGVKITEQEVKNLFNLWNDALATEDSKLVADRYAKRAVLLPTVSDIPRTSYPLIKDYFDNFLKLKPQGKILESNVVVGTNWASDAGIYEFTMGKDGSKVKGRYSFVYVYEDGQWKISHHHSSVMPEGIPKTVTITQTDVRKLFNKWNAALKTGNPDKVAACYSKKAVLLPTVSDTPRTDYNSIRDYFVTFLKRKPQGVITNGDITVGNGWAQDAGIYVFTMGDDGSKVQARYSFVYVFEDGEWKISHHHSSVMPEQFLNKKPAQLEESVFA